MQELPTGLQVFEHIRSAGALYVDKTDMIHKIVSGARMQFFISRPRRFGKTLLCWTLNALFSGKRELFEGLAIAKTDWEWESFPVVHLDMSKVTTDEGSAGVRRSLAFQMKRVANEHGIGLDAEMGAGEMLTEIIIESSKKHGKPAVVIVDEYDKPFLDFYNKPAMAEEVRDIMRGCYTQLKANEPHMRFLFMTGISKFTKAGVFSTLNNLNDISLDENFGTMLGYTEKELVECFDEHLAACAEKIKISVGELVDRLREYYNGFCFDGVHKVYNPFSMLNFLHSGEFDNYWMESANPKIIADFMKEKSLTVEQFRGMSVSRDFVRNPGNIETAPPQNFLYQAGYLTLRERIDRDFLLDYPNTEVLNSMSRLIAENIIQSGGGEFMDFRTPLIDALSENDCELFIETINRLLASIPYDDYMNAAKYGRRKKMPVQEWLYRSTILAFLRGCGVLTFGEMHGNQGRSDLIVTCRGVTWIIEIKVAKDNDCEAQAQEAMKQIDDRQYAEPYKKGKKVGIAIDDNTRQIGGWVEA
ncbi:MAG: ATP-binding protein [Chitinispirillales bacterium]|jgi:hypothetical protein|nr:ATP-binding protein [Chitinispirillales bacterium]